MAQKFEGIPAGHRIEVEEGSVEFAAKPFAAAPAAWAQGGPPAKIEALPSQIDTWLLEPLKAPEFSLPDVQGDMRALKSSRGEFVLLNFWATTSPASGDQLRLLQRQARGLQVVAVNVDEGADVEKARSFAAREKFSFPVVFATQDVAGVYNIIYRYLFDRRRDLAIPTSFLVDKEGMIVKVYQGPIDPRQLLEDVRSAPTTAAERRGRRFPSAVRFIRVRFSAMILPMVLRCSSTVTWTRQRSRFSRWWLPSRMMLKRITTWGL